MFDLTGSGFANKTGWISSGNAFLVWDRNNDNRINDISEMFGSGNQSGFKALALYDTNRDGRIDAFDDVFKNLKLWQDRNGDGRTDEGELLSLSDVGIKAINLNTTKTNINQEGNTITEVGSVEFEDGRETQAGNVNFELDRLYSYYNREVELNPEIVGLPWVRGYGFMPDLPIAMSLDNTLLQMVKDAVAETDLTKLKEKFEKIIFRWAGVENVTKQDLFGSNIRFGIRFDDEQNRVLHFDDGTILRYEQIGAALKFTGTTKEDLRGNAVIGQRYLEAWNTMFQGLFTRFVVDAGLLEDVLPVYYDFFTDKIIIDENFDVNAYKSQIKQMISSQDLNQINLAFISMMVLKETNLLEPRFIVELYTDFSENPEILTSKVLASPYVGFLFNKVILGTTGNDWLYGTDQNDIILGNSGDDRIYGYGRNDVLIGGPRDDLLDGGDGNDTLIGGAGNDQLYGGDGNDILIGGAGNDYIDGGRGSDTYVFNRGDGQDTIYDYRYSANEMNVIQFREGVTKEDVIFAQDGNDLLIKIKGTDDSLRVKYWFDRWSFNNYRGFIFRFADGTELKAEEVERIVYSGTAGDDVLYGVEKDDVIEGGSGNDRLYGYGGNDVLMGGAGNDQLYGGDGNDILIGGAGNDYMDGGRGSDTYVFNRGDGQDTIYDYRYSANEMNVIQFREGVTKEDVIFAQDGNDLLIKIKGTDDSLRVKYWFDRWSFNNYRGFIFRFADGTELKAEEVERIVYSGTAGDDVLYGTKGNNVIEGGAGNDRIYGYEGNDTLIGGPGNDYMEGGEGNDTYVFGKGDGQDTIYEYKSNNNDINIITINENKENIIFSKNRNDLIIGYSDKDYIKVLYQFNSKNYGIDKIEVKDGYYITRWDIENIVNAMIDFTNDKGMSYAEIYNNLLNNQNFNMLLSQSWSKSWVDSMGSIY